ncbi:MAG: DUF58 domain-containing protein [Planctomycetota bacterium]|nr:DUF58 domain-containing protein [Planctomycetota bacterium]
MSTLDSPFLSVEDLRRLRGRLFASRGIVAGRYAGRHASRRPGRSAEFTEHRPFIPGDSPADLDWKLFARSDRLFVRLSEQPSDLSVHLVVDASASMAFAGLDAAPDRATSKFTHAARIAAAIAFLAVEQNDRVSLSIASAGLARFVTPDAGPGQLRAILDALEAAKPAGAAGLDAALRALAPRVGRRGVVVVLSDLLDPPGPVFDALALLHARGHEVLLLHVLHAHEIDLPSSIRGQTSLTLLEDAESHQRLEIDLASTRAAYAAEFARFQRGWADAARARGHDYQLVSTATPCVRALEHCLLTRASS